MELPERRGGLSGEESKGKAGWGTWKLTREMVVEVGEKLGEVQG